MCRHTSILRFSASAIIVVLLTSAASAQDSPGQKMVTAANRFLQVLDHSQKLQATFKYDDPERINWHFIPRERRGIGLWDLDGATKDAANALVQTGLTAAGYHKVLEVRSLEEVLYLFEGGDEAERRKKRHPHRYYVSIFGTPAAKGLWGWRFEGHHLSLNYSVQTERLSAARRNSSVRIPA